MNGDHDRYEAAIKALGSSTEMPRQKAARIERDLQCAFAARHAVMASPARPEGNRRWRPWLAAAAAVLAAAIGIQVWREARTVTENYVMGPSPTLAPTLLPGAPTRTVPKQESVPDPRTGAATRSVVRPKRPVARVVRPSGFVALPGSTGLPQFESGMIVRMELQLASLPAYGIDISPAADDRPVEADVLVGQDGQPRAMRLITNSSRSVQ
jgi:hypothetical protein